MILEKGIPEEILRTGYWCDISLYHKFIIELEIIKDRCVKATSFEVDTSYISDIDIDLIKNGTEVKYRSSVNDSDWWLKMDIHNKYYFPKFNEDKNQWYHKNYEGDHDFIIDFCDLVKYTYDIAMKVSGLKTY
jgi:hypothetical protein